MNGLLGNPEALRKLAEQQGLFSAPPELQPALMARLLQQGLLQPQPESWLSQFVNAAKVFNPSPGRPLQPKNTATVGVRG